MSGVDSGLSDFCFLTGFDLYPAEKGGVDAESPQVESSSGQDEGQQGTTLVLLFFFFFSSSRLSLTHIRVDEKLRHGCACVGGAAASSSVIS